MDHYYYLEYSDPKGEVYGVARVHFQTMSNRRARPNNKFSGDFDKRLALNMSRFAPSPSPRRANAVTIRNMPIFNHISELSKDGMYVWE